MAKQNSEKVEETNKLDQATDTTPEQPTAPQVELVNGRVVGCGLLRVRKAATAKAEVLQELAVGTKVDVDLKGSSRTFYRVVIDGVEGFCMKDYIEV